MPTSSEMITVRVAKMIPVFGSVKPIALKKLNRPFASRSPRKRPVTDAIVPITSASMKIDRRTWPRVAPRVRSVANSRVRCAIVIESEFAITKLPTKSAMPPNASRKPRRNEMNESVSLASSAACWAPVRTCAFAGMTDRDLVDQLLVRDGRLGCDVDLVELAGLVEQSLRRRHVETGKRCPADVQRARTELDDARDLEPHDRPLGLDADLVADREVLVVRRSCGRSPPRRRAASARRAARAD